jgi:regulator of cell morphogenesis and NO signaling
MAIEPTFTPDLTLSEVIRRLPEAVNVFEETEIDYSCQGARSLADAAKDGGYGAEDLIARLETARRRNNAKDWFEESLTDLLQYLTGDHRITLDDRIPTIQSEIERVIGSLGEVEEIQRIRILFSHLSESLSTHVMNEERELFPFITDLDAAVSESMGPPRMRISQRVLRELLEHETFRDRFRTLRELAERLPDNEVVDALRRDLKLFSNEVQRHMHLENNVLYPRAIDIENGLRRGKAASA